MLGGEGKVVLLKARPATGPAEEARRGHEEVLAAKPGHRDPRCRIHRLVAG